jgi:hypothetical protein
MQIKQVALGVGAFVAGAAALTAGAVALAARRERDDPTDARAEPAANGRPLAPAHEVDLADTAAPTGGAGPRHDPVPQGPAPSRQQARAPSTAAGEEGHAVPDLAPDADPTSGRAAPAFRPDMDAPMTPAEREALRPAAGPAPTLVDAGTSMPG